ncbi:hypothetical protein [Rheinheimera maricola]|uniref:UDP-2,4-diacetamido-2,4, 6-trideoxy-beta-L-altropyranose hydrolase n=1 Tax=Rheinheimera maricola TaxID=2793282 RepID=A0ABS7X3T3_9GAMM|nr:hypothetical protein [Rheinheimera maricola]MBZ9610219.1 hypothetical protein [Rheinheimera maricola]
MISFIISAGTQIGLGHLKRCQVLAEYLSAQVKCQLLLVSDADCSEHIKPAIWHSINLFSAWPSDWVKHIAASSRVVLVDSYIADELINDSMAAYGGEWGRFVFNVPRVFSGGFLISYNQTLASATALRHFSQPIKQFFGLEYFIVAPLFNRQSLHQVEKAQTVFLSFGAGDDRGWIMHFIEKIRSVSPDKAITIATTKLNPALMALQQHCKTLHNVSLYCSPSHYAELLAAADLAIVASGTTLMEAVALQIPAASIVLVDNQQHIQAQLLALGCVVDAEDDAQLQALLSQPTSGIRAKLTRCCAKLDVASGAQRLANKLLELSYVV